MPRPSAWPPLVALGLAAFAAAPAVRAQAPGPATAAPPGLATNADVLGRLAADCLGGVPPPQFRLDAPALAPYLRTALVRAWTAGERTAFVGADSAFAGSVLAVRVEGARVRYARAGRGRLRRTADLAVRYALTDARSALVADDICTRTATDVVSTRALGALETAAYPETVGVRPGVPGWRRVAEPVLLGGAVVVSALLFFSLRSR